MKTVTARSAERFLDSGPVAQVGICTAAGRMGSISASAFLYQWLLRSCAIRGAGAPLVFELSKEVTGSFDFFVGQTSFEFCLSQSLTNLDVAS